METTLYSKNGKSVAYVADDGETIYLWDGHAVAYLHEDKVYGFNGKLLGWFANGIIYDMHGHQIGFTQGKCPSVTLVPSVKSVKYVKSVKSVRSVPYVRPILSRVHSDEDLQDFLEGS
jgi:hypothetical protein